MQTGDIVYLKSGGPPMTVCDAPSTGDYAGQVFVMWFEGAKLNHLVCKPEYLVTDPPEAA